MLSGSSLLLPIIAILSASSSAAFVTSPFQLRQHSKPLAHLRVPQPNVCRPYTLQSCVMGQSTGQQESAVGKEAGSKEVIKGILFDIDGTLFDSDPVHFDVFEELLGKEGIVCDEEFFRTKIAGRQNQLIMQDLFPEWSVEKSTAWSDAKEARFRELAPGKLKAMPGLIELMEWIDEKGLKKAAVTNAPRDNAEMMLNSIGRLDWFDCLIIGDECERAKPDPFPYQLAMTKLGLEPGSSMVIEDSPSGRSSPIVLRIAYAMSGTGRGYPLRAGAVRGLASQLVPTVIMADPERALRCPVLRSPVAAAGALTVGILTSQPAEALTDQGCKLLIHDYFDEQLWAVLDKDLKR